MGFSGPPIPIDELSNRKDLAKAIQWRLHDLGYLDPPADGVFGPVSIWALDDFCLRNALELGNIFTKDVAKLLVAPKKNLPKIIAGKNWFDKVITYMEMKNYFISKHPDCFNIIYLEGANTDGALNSDLPNMFNDVRILFKIGNDGRPVFDEWIWEATTEPGKYWTENPMNPKGAARIAFDQYKAWRVGTHRAGTTRAHEALVQIAPVTVFRDLNKDYKRPGDKPDSGLFGINQHWGYDASESNLGRSSAGCLVGRSTSGHKDFMKLVKKDARFMANRGYRFMTAILPANEVFN